MKIVPLAKAVDLELKISTNLLLNLPLFISNSLPSRGQTLEFGDFSQFSESIT